MIPNLSKTKLLKSQSISIRFSFGSLILRTLLVLILFLFVFEGISRTNFIKDRIPVESWGVNHDQFEIKWRKLQAFVEEHGGVDVLIIGSSEVNSGIIPDEINAFLSERTGQSLRIFNLGIEGFTINLNALLIPYLIETYHPKLIILGTEIRDYSSETSLETIARITSSPWIQYINGGIFIEGWLAENSQSFRYFLAYRNWTHLDFPTHLQTIANRLPDVLENGYEQDNQVNLEVSDFPNPNDADEQEKFEAYSDFVMDPDRLNSLNEFLNLRQTANTWIIVVELPIYPTFWDYFGNGEADHDLFVRTVSEAALSSGNFFISSLPIEDIPSNGWANRTHVNKYGAPIFSRYLGEQITALLIAEGFNFNSNLIEGDD